MLFIIYNVYLFYIKTLKYCIYKRKGFHKNRDRNGERRRVRGIGLTLTSDVSEEQEDEHSWFLHQSIVLAEREHIADGSYKTVIEQNLNLSMSKTV